MILLMIVAAILLGGACFAYFKAFFHPRKGRWELHPILKPGYDPYRPEMRRIYRILKERPYEAVSIQSRDGLKLTGRYYHVKDGAPLDIGFHGYKSHSTVDFSGGSELSFELEHNLLLIDQRAHGDSEGHTISFGIKERHDLLEWVRYCVERFGPDTEIMLYGVSMGGATVLLAANLDLPKNVRGIVADCPYASPLEIVLHVGEEMPIPRWLIKPFVILGARLFGGFDITQVTATQTVKETKVPILIIHGQEDTLVPWAMSRAVQEANPAMVRYFLVPGAEHAISYLVDREGYRRAVLDFMASL